ncbi:MAG: transketolase C-terminal domain-containing protein, partial [Bacteroidales bacterium]|nr:transketolase C-terminal domain-containing protein [Bacteroidales bacterium]MDY5281487.1 transketolase C-terminal domain-containing protein [Sodaliphilus sp.]
LYSQLALIGNYTIDDLKNFRQWGSCTPGHPEVCPERGIENTSGPLGQGHTYAVGAAIAAKALYARTGNPGFERERIYAYISDGGVQEEISQGAGRIAGHLGLNNLIMFFDANEIQLSTETAAVISEDTGVKYRAWNWNVLEIDGTDPVAIADALESAQKEEKRPTLIIGHTIMGRGCVTEDGENFEGKCSTHGNPLSKSGASYEKTIANLGGDINNVWATFPEVKELYAEREIELVAIVAERKAAQEAWRKANPEKAKMLDDCIAGKVVDVDYASITHKPNIATRAASSNVLGELAVNVPNMIVSSADLANSDKTDGFLKKTKAFAPHDFEGAFLHAGVSELAMTSIINGIALHGGMIGACATFFVFSDYMKPAVRLSALMELPVKFIWSHDAFRVGEDGPTHEPVEQEAQIRLLEELKNHSGRNSMLVLRPADSAETTVAWKMAMENTNTPTALILTRQDVTDIPAEEGEGYEARYKAALQAERGGYIVKTDKDADVILVANGSEVSALVAAGKIIEKENIKYQIVSVPSIGLFLNQDAAYRNEVIPTGKPAFGLTAGLPSTLARLIPNGHVKGLDHFGESAPFKVLDEKFGFTPEIVAKEILDYVKNEKK